MSTQEQGDWQGRTVPNWCCRLTPEPSGEVAVPSAHEAFNKRHPSRDTDTREPIDPEFNHSRLWRTREIEEKGPEKSSHFDYDLGGRSQKLFF